ncbi:hypothetical protein ACFE04_015687 [Oxalis oulophora]
MKILTKSPSVSSSSSSFDTNMFISRNASNGCFARILRRFLRKIPAHPSNPDLVRQTLSDKDQDSQGSGTPCLVGRLMGLDSYPELIIHKKIVKSKVESTLSLRKVPEFLEIENNEEFIEFSFEIGSKKGYRKREKSRNRVNKAEVTKLDLQTTIKVLNEEIYDTTRRVTDEHCQKLDCNNNKEVYNSAKLKKKKKIALNRRAKDAQHDQCSSSEESSPVSVLDFGQFIIDPQNPSSEEVGPRSAQVNSKRTLSQELKNYGNLSSSKDDNPINNDSKPIECYNKDYLETWSEANILTMEEIKESNWTSSKAEEFDDICSNFESQILDTLLGEIVIEL